VTLCALSAHLLPTRTVLSKPVSCPARACAAAARSLAIFCCGVSLRGAALPIGIDDDAAGVFAAAYGPVAVKRVASDADRGMSVMRIRRSRTEGQGLYEST